MDSPVAELELSALCLNVAANAYMLWCVCRDAACRVPHRVVLLQCGANVLWFASATLRRDPFLSVAAVCNASTQCGTLCLLCRTESHTSTRTPIVEATSEERLPSLPLPAGRRDATFIPCPHSKA